MGLQKPMAFAARCAQLSLSFSLFFCSLCAAQDIEPPTPWISGEHAGHEYVDLGLPSGTLWATCNIGATAQEETGYFFAWGEVEPRDWFESTNYLYNTGEWINDPKYGCFYLLEDLGDNICGTKYDAAAHQWGNGWRMPNSVESYELVRHCWNKWTVENGVRGRRIYGPNTNSIFLPSGGFGAGPDNYYGQEIGRTGVFWCGLTVSDFAEFPYPEFSAMAILIDDGVVGRTRGSRYTGKNIRPVYNPIETGANAVYGSGMLAVAYRQGRFMVSGFNGPVTLRVQDTLGRTLQVSELNAPATVETDVCGGVYLVTVSDGNRMLKSKKIIINR